MCSPTRFALITGRWQYRLRGAAEEPLAAAHGDKILGLPPEHPTLPSLLAQAGYATSLVGKWHLGYAPHFGPRMSSYQEFWGFHGGGVDYFAHTGPRGGADLWHDEEAIHCDGYLTDLLSERAVDCIERQSPDRPFLLSLHYSAPHWPWLTRDDREESKRTHDNGMHLDGGSIDTYQRMIHHMDQGIGQVLAALERKGVWPRTRWSSSPATTAASASPTTGRSWARRWICSRAASGFRCWRAGRPRSPPARSTPPPAA